MRRTDFLMRPLFAALCTYFIAVGATFNGVLLPQIASLTLPLMGGLLFVWGVARLHGHWIWYRTPVDAALILWGVAIFLSFLANSDDWRRSMIGGWYIAAYALTWWALTDGLANRVLRRSTIIDGLLIAGVFIMGVGAWQVINIVLNGWRYAGLFGLPRPVSTIGNPNAFGAFLVIVIAFATGRWLTLTSRVWRVLLAVYIGVAGVLLLLTYSRGAWLGAGAALLTIGVLSFRQLRSAFAQQRPAVKAFSIGAAGVGLIAAVGVSVVLVASLSEGGRTTELRTYLWEAALTQFNEQPLSGQGLFTFGKGLQRLESSPPGTPHSHAHNVPLHVLAELGAVGFAVLLLSLMCIVWAVRRNLRDVSERERGILIGGAAALVGFAVHHLFDIPSMMPGIALVGVLAAVVAVTPIESAAMNWHLRRLGHAFALAVLAVGLITSGLWSTRIYAAYIEALQIAFVSSDYAGAAQALEPVIDSDPALALYSWQQGMLYGLAASVNDDQNAARAGAAAFERALQSERQNAILWANLGALRWQLNDTYPALESFARASELAPRSWQLAFVWARHAEAAGDDTAARLAYIRMIEIEPSATLHPDVSASPFVQALSPSLTGLPEIVRLYLANDRRTAQRLWDAVPVETVPGYVMQALLTDDRDESLRYLVQAEALWTEGNDIGLEWLRYGQARYRGDVYTPLEPDLLSSDYGVGVNIGRGQFLRDVLPRQFLPQVDYEGSDPMLLALVAVDEQSAK